MVAGVMFMVLCSVLSAWTPDKKPEPREHPIKFVIFDYRIELITVFAIISGVGTLVAGWTGSRRKSIEYFLDHLHKRTWNKNGGKDPDYRLSLFVEDWHGGKLKCYARTDGHTTDKKWSCTPPNGKDADGIVGLVWHTGIMAEVDALPEKPTETDLRQYLESTYIDAATFDKLSWKGAAMLGVPISISAGEVSGVLLVECRRPGSRVTFKEFPRDAEVAGMIWEGRL